MLAAITTAFGSEAKPPSAVKGPTRTPAAPVV